MNKNLSAEEAERLDECLHKTADIVRGAEGTVMLLRNAETAEDLDGLAGCLYECEEAVKDLLQAICRLRRIAW